MPIRDLQTQLRELGRIRAGEKVATASGKTRPAKLSTWRLTSPSKRLLDAAAEKYGGTVAPWEDEKVQGQQFQLTTDADTLDVIIPPGVSATQFYETWSADGCTRRCDGVTEMISGEACKCSPDPEERACKPTTRVRFLLGGIPEVGVWLLQSHGYYAAVEMGAILKLCELATTANRVIPAQLRLEQRTVKKPGKAPNHFAVPVIDIGVSPDQVLTALGVLDGTFAPALTATPRPALPEGQPDLPPDPAFEIERPVLPVTEIPPSPPPPGEPGALGSQHDQGGTGGGPTGSLARGMEQAAAGALVDLGSFAQHAEPMTTEEIASELGGTVVEGEADAASEAAVASPPSTGSETWDAKTWLAKIKRAKLTQRDVLGYARDYAATQGLPVPGALGALTGDVGAATRAHFFEQAF